MLAPTQLGHEGGTALATLGVRWRNSRSPPDEWRALRQHAETLMEAGNLLLIPGRKVARPGEKAGDPRVDLPPDEIEARIARDPSVCTSHARSR